MLILVEKIIFVIAVALTIYAAVKATQRLTRIISAGQGRPDYNLAIKKAVSVLAKTVTLTPTWRIRKVSSLFHAMVAWGFMFYLLVNVGDVLQAFIPGYVFLGEGTIGNLYRLLADWLSVAVLLGMSYLMFRRYVFNPKNLQIKESTTLHPKAQKGIRMDSLIVGVFILLHVGFRFIGESFHIAIDGEFDSYQIFASTVAGLWHPLSATGLTLGAHISFWIAIGLILAFIPYFPRSKHFHLFFAPINFLLNPERTSMGALNSLDFEDESIESFGVTYIEDLGYEQIVDAYACIMCNRCQEVCPAYNTGKVLSPAALEINKRYFLNYEGDKIASGEGSETRLVDFAISEEAIWACTACGACIDICPVGNEPMRDILQIRRSLVLMENQFPEQLQNAYRGMERTMNPWNISQADRMKWAEGLNVPTIEDNPDAEYLWWVGCAPSTDPNAQKSARSMVKILDAAGINYAVLGNQENCTGDSARRSGNEYLFYELALTNVEILNEINPKTIITTCPHCLHTLKNEYRDFGGNYNVIHHTQLISDLLMKGQLHIEDDAAGERITLHDPCYLGRQNGIIEEPRLSIRQTGASYFEMPLSGTDSFCCGAGGAQIWKEEEDGNQPVNLTRFKEAEGLNPDALAVACPFCMIMMNDAANELESTTEVKDIAQIVADKIKSEASH